MAVYTLIGFIADIFHNIKCILAQAGWRDTKTYLANDLCLYFMFIIVRHASHVALNIYCFTTAENRFDVILALGGTIGGEVFNLVAVWEMGRKV